MRRSDLRCPHGLSRCGVFFCFSLVVCDFYFFKIFIDLRIMQVCHVSFLCSYTNIFTYWVLFEGTNNVCFIQSKRKPFTSSLWIRTSNRLGGICIVQEKNALNLNPNDENITDGRSIRASRKPAILTNVNQCRSVSSRQLSVLFSGGQVFWGPFENMQWTHLQLQHQRRQQFEKHDSGVRPKELGE